jgi:hypothetical protein
MNSPFYHCPLCKSENISGGHVEIDSDSAWQPVTCDDCGYDWNEVYNFARAETPDTCKEIDENGKLVPERDLWSNDNRYPRADWKYDVVNGNTNLGYWDWVENKYFMQDDEELLNGTTDL